MDETLENTLLEESRKGRIEKIQSIIERSPNLVYYQNSDGWTALYVASQMGHSDVVQYLLKNGANILATTKCRETALHVGSSFGHVEIVRYLLREGAVLAMKDKNGRTALHIAALMGHFEIVQHFIHKDAKVLDIVDNRGWTALYIATMHQHSNIKKLLLDAGANLNVLDNNGKGPMDIVCYKPVTGRLDEDINRTVNQMSPSVEVNQTKTNDILFVESIDNIDIVINESKPLKTITLQDFNSEMMSNFSCPVQQCPSIAPVHLKQSYVTKFGGYNAFPMIVFLLIVIFFLRVLYVRPLKSTIKQQQAKIDDLQKEKLDLQKELEALKCERLAHPMNGQDGDCSSQTSDDLTHESETFPAASIDETKQETL